VPLLLLLASPATAAADRPPRRKLQPRSGPSPLSIEARGLAARDVGAAELAEGAREWEGGAAAARRRFGGRVLAYVTPWCAASLPAARVVVGGGALRRGDPAVAVEPEHLEPPQPEPAQVQAQPRGRCAQRHGPAAPA
jgi:hypothetical protein